MLERLSVDSRDQAVVEPYNTATGPALLVYLAIKHDLIKSLQKNGWISRPAMFDYRSVALLFQHF